MYTFSGVRFYLIDPRPEEVNMTDIAHSLSQQCRFTGHTKRFYSVAEHCCRMVDFAADWATHLRDWILMHDAAEAYIGDMNRPLKRGCGEVGVRYQEVEERILEAIHRRFSLNWPIHEEVERLDARMLVTEAQQVYDHHPPWIKEGIWSHIDPIPTELGFWDPRKAEEQFLNRADELELR